MLITWWAKLLKYDWLIRRAFFLNSGQKLLDPDWLRRFILSITVEQNIKSIQNKDSLINKILYIKYISYIRFFQCFN